MTKYNPEGYVVSEGVQLEPLATALCSTCGSVLMDKIVSQRIELSNGNSRVEDITIRTCNPACNIQQSLEWISKARLRLNKK